MNLTERTVSSREIFKGRAVSLRVDEVELPDGRKSTREIISHPGAVAIMALDDDHNLIMVRQYRKAIERTTLEIPAGTREAGEHELLCAQRELEEETGLRADHWQEILHYYSAVGFCNEKIHLFLASGLNPGQSNPDEDEFVETAKVPLEQAYEMIFSGEISDGKSIIAIQYLINNQKKG